MAMDKGRGELALDGPGAGKEYSGSFAATLIVSNDGEFRTVRLDYHDGEKYPRLERVQGTPDLLDEILKPLAADKGSGI